MKLKLFLLLCMIPAVTYPMEPSEGTPADNETEETDPNIIGIRKLNNHITAIKKLIDECGKTGDIKQHIHEYFEGYEIDDVRPRNFWRIHQDNLEASTENVATLKKVQQKAIASQLALYELDLLNNPEAHTIPAKIKNAQTLLEQYKSQHIMALENQKTIKNNHCY